MLIPLNQVPVAGWWECLLWSSLLGMFNQLFHSDCCTGWQLLESGRGTSAEQESDRDTARLAEAAVQPRLSAIPPGKRPLFPDDAVENCLCLCTSIAELNVLPIVFSLHCLHLLTWTESWTRWCWSLPAWTCIWCCRAVGYQNNLLINSCGTPLQFWPFPDGHWYRMRKWSAVSNYIYFQNTWLSPMVCSVPWKKSSNRRKRDTFVPYMLMQLQALQHFSSHKSWFCAGILPLFLFPSFNPYSLPPVLSWEKSIFMSRI